MKRIIAVMATLILSVGCYAQDMIVKKDGSIIQAKVSEIGTSEVKYKKWSNQSGSSYTLAKNKVQGVHAITIVASDYDYYYCAYGGMDVVRIPHSAIGKYPIYVTTGLK